MPHTGGLFRSAAGFANQFRQAYGYDPPYQSAQSAAAVEVLADALKRAGTLDAGRVRDALAATDLKTFFGLIRFDETGRNVAKPMAISQVIDGHYVVVAPPQWSTAQPVFQGRGNKVG